MNSLFTGILLRLRCMGVGLRNGNIAQNYSSLILATINRISVRALTLVCVFSLGAITAHGACDLRILTAGPCLGDSTPGTPAVGDIYGLRITVALTGTPAKPFRIKWTIANRTIYFDNINISPGYGYWWWMTQWMSLDGQIPWTVTLDPDNVTGDTNLSNNTISGILEPLVPAVAVETYSPRTLYGQLSGTTIFKAGSGTIPLLSKLFGIPSSHGTQQVLSYALPSAGRLIYTQPNNMPVCEVLRTNAIAGTYTDTLSFTIRASKMRVNPTLLSAISWQTQEADLPGWLNWTAPEVNSQSTAPEVTAFVAKSLPANYRTSMTPYDAARTLHRAVAKELDYLSTAPAGDAVGVLKNKTAACGGFSALLVAALRNIGIPARMIGGFWQGKSVWHIRVEFHLPGLEWIVADPTFTNAEDTTGTYAYFFGQDDAGNGFISMDAGDRHIRDYATFGILQVPNWFWNGGATFVSNDGWSYLQPLSAITLTSLGQNNVRLDLKDVPNLGTFAIESSNDLVTWQSVVTATSDGLDKTYTYPLSAPRVFYRVRLMPP